MMKLANVIKDSLDETPFCLKAIKSASVFMFEHPLNHGKRLGIIRLNNKSLETQTVIELLQHQLIAWQKDENVIGLWFESDNEKYHLNSEADLWVNTNIEVDRGVGQKLSALMRQIKTYPKVCMLWCDQTYSPSLSLLFDAVNFSLVHAHSGYPLLDSKPIQGVSIAKLKLFDINSGQENRERLTLIDVYPIVCQRSRLLELLSSHPWHKKACKLSEQCFSQLFKESLTLIK